ncbi:MAG: response regulator [Spirochaetota bacterium]
MLVEDDTIIGRYLSEVLEEGGYDVIQCLSNGRDALRAAVPLKPDLVLMDISLPGDIDGVEVAKRFKTLHDLPVVFITAHSDRKTIERGARCRLLWLCAEAHHRRPGIRGDRDGRTAQQPRGEGAGERGGVAPALRAPANRAREGAPAARAGDT